MIETIMSVVLVGGVFIAALDTAGSAAASRREALFRSEGMLIAQDAMAEILQQAYAEPSVAVPIIGTDLTGLLAYEGGESNGDGTRNGFDDIDDYNAWSGTAQDKQGTPLDWASRYRVSVAVAPVQLDKLWKVSLTETGVKSVHVTVTRGGRTVAQLVAYRSKAWGGRVE